MNRNRRILVDLVLNNFKHLPSSKEIKRWLTGWIGGGGCEDNPLKADIMKRETMLWATIAACCEFLLHNFMDAATGDTAFHL
ncbi:hypothetical protein NECAME_00712 [Necator americanus]|uniref:Uncharacterized protein n=1 Tax=Necator americanus TaxID=51031 RepID=W2SVF3_NECAM|nr:hypothetical protein NECAME_00712 [Necator americanus]ETN73625.1 hypothetical protein NECAME_00712 [Necator americanus]